MQNMYSDKTISTIPGIIWPATPDFDAAIRLALLRQFDETQWWPAEMIQQHQMKQLELLLKHASQTVPFYLDRMNRAGWDPNQVITPESFRQFPLLTRDEVNQAGHMLYAKSVPKQHGSRFKISTSGSTGNPVTIMKTAWSQIVWDVVTLRDHLWRSRDFTGRLGAIRHLPPGKGLAPDGMQLPDWGVPVSRVYTSASSFGLSIRSKVSEQLDWLIKVNPDYLLTFPSVAEALALLSKSQGLVPHNLREVRTLGETLSADTRELIKEIWKVPVSDCYSAQEVGYIALQAPAAEYYLVQAESAYVEILDQHNLPCKPGETGRVVVTPLQNFATPLIRYALDDFAEVGVTSACGRGLPVLNRILGRSRNMLVLPDGQRRFAALGIKSFNKQNGENIRKYQVVQKTSDRLEVSIRVHQRYTEAQESAFKKHIQTTVGHAFNIDIMYVDDIPNSRNGKYEDFRCEITSG